jgi:hypothetical protein
MNDIAYFLSCCHLKTQFPPTLLENNPAIHGWVVAKKREKYRKGRKNLGPRARLFS